MKRPSRPDLKLPDVRPPAFLADLYYDLRDRRLLPLVGLVVVATAAVPLLLGDSREVAPPPVASGAGAGEEALEQPATLTVVEAKPGLRDYRKRLRARTPSDPFAQKYTSVPQKSQLKSLDSDAEGSGGGAGGETGAEVEVTEEPSGGGETGGGSPGGESGGSGSPVEGGTRKGGSAVDLTGKRLVGFRPDIRFGVAGSEQLKTHEELPLGSLLPKKRAVLLFVGATQNGKRVLFSVAPEVTRVRGNGDCVGGKSNCQILSMRVGTAVDLLTDTPGRVFRLKVTRIAFVELPLPKKTERASGSKAGPSRPGWARAVAQNFSK